MKKVNNIVTTTLTNIFSNNKIVNSKILNNKISLYVVAAIAFISLYRHIVMYEFSAVLLFFLVGALTFSFTKNMTIVLGTSFLVTFFVSMFKGLFGFKEGAANMKDEDEDKENMKEDSTTKLIEKAISKGTSKPSKEQSGYTNQIPLTPGLYNMPNKEQMTKQLGKASETEQAYDNLEKIMGSKNIQTMSTDTQDLIRQQNDLIKQLKSMTPALNDAMATLGSLDLGKLTGIFNKPTEKQE
jgi:Sec-independent protein translocase protein TatA